MRTTELFRTCANEHVAAAALACLGGKFERRVAAAARRAGKPAGAFVSALLADYDRKASPRRRKLLELGMFRHDMPLLAGLRHVLETALEGAWDVARDAAPSVGRDYRPIAAKPLSRESALAGWRTSPASERTVCGAKPLCG